MTKGIRITHLIGYIIEAIAAVSLVGLFIVALLISLPSNQDIIRKGLIDGSISMNPSMTIEENVAYIQKMFIVFGVVVFVMMAIFISNTIISFIISKRQDSKKLIISSLVLSVIGFNPLLIVTNSLLLKNYGVEVIEVN